MLKTHKGPVVGCIAYFRGQDKQLQFVYFFNNKFGDIIVI